MSDSQYRENGYVVLKGSIPARHIAELRGLISSEDLHQRKSNLLGNARLRQGIDRLIRPLFAEIGIVVNEIVELHALAALDGKSVKLSWHKDRPAGGGIHAFQLPLFDADVFHELVPASHARELTDSEIAARNAGGDSMPGAIHVKLDIGDVLLRSPLILHRGYNPRGNRRLTIVGTYT